MCGRLVQVELADLLNFTGETAISHSLLPQVAELSLRGRLAIALHCLEAYSKNLGLDHPALQRFIDYHWGYLVVDAAETRQSGNRENVELLDIAMEFDYPDGFEDFLSSKGVDAEEFSLLLVSTYDIMDGSTFAATDNTGSLKDLATIFAIMEKHRVAIPTPSLFKSSPWKDNDGRGFALTPAAVKQWRECCSTEKT
jgi:hypothetical protein